MIVEKDPHEDSFTHNIIEEISITSEHIAIRKV